MVLIDVVRCDSLVTRFITALWGGVWQSGNKIYVYNCHMGGYGRRSILVGHIAKLILLVIQAES